MTELIKTVHFKVGDGFTDLVRQIFWYEDKYRGYKLLDTLNGITIGQKEAVLEGDAHLEPTEDGCGMNLIYKEDKKFKKELADHKIFVKEQEERKKIEEEEFMERVNELVEAEAQRIEDGEPPTPRRNARKKTRKDIDDFMDSVFSPSMQGKKFTKRKSTKKAKKHLGKCREECKYNHGDKCMFGMRDLWGCWIETEGIEDKYWELINIRKKEAGLRYANQEESKGHFSLAREIERKVYNFLYKGHEYVLGDSARNQGECPHCGEQAPTDHFWRPQDKAFIGDKKLGDKQYAYCFECPKCFKKFFYHNISAKEGT